MTEDITWARMIRPIVMRGFRDRMTANDVTDAIVAALAAAPPQAIERSAIEIAREALARRSEADGAQHTAAMYREGRYDDEGLMPSAIDAAALALACRSTMVERKREQIARIVCEAGHDYYAAADAILPEITTPVIGEGVAAWVAAADWLYSKGFANASSAMTMHIRSLTNSTDKGDGE